MHGAPVFASAACASWRPGVSSDARANGTRGGELASDDGHDPGVLADLSRAASQERCDLLNLFPFPFWR
jgi:hypothetical protein